MTNGVRLASLDVLRGFDMLFIMGFTGFLTQLLAALGCPCVWLETQFEHAAWHGLRFEDTIFPLFLFLAGVSWPFSLAKRRVNGDATASIIRKILKRGLALVLLGFVYNGVLKLDLGNMVWGAVLVRIGLAWMLAALLSVFVGVHLRIGIAVAILLAHWAVCVLIAAPDASGLDPLSAKGCFAGWVDRVLMPGRLTQPGIISNQGVFSTLPAVVTAMLGIFAGELLRRKDLSGNRKALMLAIAAVVLAVAGLIVAYGFGRYSMPLNKILWSSSFTLTVGGYSAAMLALFYWLIDVTGWWKRTLFFRVIGMNSLTIYMANAIVSFSAIGAFFAGGLAECLPSEWECVVLSAAMVAAEWLFLYFLYRQKIFLKV